MVGVGGVVIDGDSVLLVRRAREPLKGKWSLPGGLVETGETLSSALRREIAEETGLRVRVEGVVEVLDYIMHGSRRARRGNISRPARYHYVLVDFRCRVAGTRTLRASSDISEARWVPRRELGKYRLRAATLRVIEKAFQGKR